MSRHFHHFQELPFLSLHPTLIPSARNRLDSEKRSPLVIEGRGVSPHLLPQPCHLCPPAFPIPALPSQPHPGKAERSSQTPTDMGRSLYLLFSPLLSEALVTPFLTSPLSSDGSLASQLLRRLDSCQLCAPQAAHSEPNNTRGVEGQVWGSGASSEVSPDRQSQPPHLETTHKGQSTALWWALCLGVSALVESTFLTESVRGRSTECSHGACTDGAEYDGQATFHPEVTQGRRKHQDSTCTSPDGQYQNQIDYLIIFFAAISQRWRSSI